MLAHIPVVPPKMPENIHIEMAKVTQGLQEEPQLRVEQDATTPYMVQDLYLWATGSNAEHISAYICI